MYLYMSHFLHVQHRQLYADSCGVAGPLFYIEKQRVCVRSLCLLFVLLSLCYYRPRSPRCRPSSFCSCCCCCCCFHAIASYPHQELGFFAACELDCSAALKATPDSVTWQWQYLEETKLVGKFLVGTLDPCFAVHLLKGKELNSGIVRLEWLILKPTYLRRSVL